MSTDVLVMRLAVAIINVPSGVGRRAWRRCWRLTAQRAQIFGINEAFHPVAKRLYRRLAQEEGYGQYGIRKCPNPIFWDRDLFRFVSGEVHLIHVAATGFLARRWPGFNAERYVNLVVLEPRAGGPQIAVLCSHWVPNGGRVSAAWRLWARAKSQRDVRALLREERAAGRVGLFLADTNIREVFNKLGRHFRWLKGWGIDKVGVNLPRGWRLVRKRVRQYAAPTDHKHGVLARLTLRQSPAGNFVLAASEVAVAVTEQEARR